MFFGFILSLLGQNLLFNPSINAFVIGSVEWLTYSSRIDSSRPVRLFWYFSIAHNLTLELFLAFKVDFPLLGNSNHVVSISVDFPVSSKGDVPFHQTTTDYSLTD